MYILFVFSHIIYHVQLYDLMIAQFQFHFYDHSK